jgi:hypothetical protein
MTTGSYPDFTNAAPGSAVSDSIKNEFVLTASAWWFLSVVLPIEGRASALLQDR